MHLITTQTGKTIAVENLLKKGQFQALLKDYPQLGQPLFGEDCIHVIQDARGRLLDDISTDEENTWAADSITRLMAELTRDENAILHVSMSGGRKTMGFYVGYAFSLFARPADELSHVLVSSPFESEREFYFPPAKPRMLSIRNGTQANTKDAVTTRRAFPSSACATACPKNSCKARPATATPWPPFKKAWMRPHSSSVYGKRK